jgi:2-succinyl-5-enolpyruvyl-6-hydroxy-3-cyclohexene-1-carboxylate synthase
MDAPNRNYVWTYTFVDALAQAGLRSVVLAPGSRSTPLTMAFAWHSRIRVFSHIDERGAAFMALGLALAQDAPAAVVCSSGTAAANFYPAIVEAHYAHVPLLVLTADRPHELRDSGANQTVDQVKLFGDHVLWAVDAALPEANPLEVMLRSLRSLAARALALADGTPRGAVHLNFPFRKPLEPTPVEGEVRELGGWEAGEVQSPTQQPWETGNGRATAPMTEAARADLRCSPRIERGRIMPTAAHIARLKHILGKKRRILIVCGPRTPGGAFASQVNRLAAGGAVLLADGLSSVRYFPEQTHVIAGYEHFLHRAHTWQQPDAVIHFGAMPTSQRLLDYLNTIQPEYRLVISDDGSWTDFEHRIDWLLQADPEEVCKSLAAWWLRQQRDQDWCALFAVANETAQRALRADSAHLEWFDAIAVLDALALLERANIFVANSLPVRHLDQFGSDQRHKQLRVFCNRGASGIDGTISSALGMAAAEPDKPTVLIIGDLAFYHDMNALLAAKRNHISNLVIVLLNNNGGQIFRRLPINQPQFEPAFTDLFITPHGMTFEHTAAQFGLGYARAEDRAGFRAAFTAALARGEASIVEVVTDAVEDARRRKALMDKMAAEL